MYILCRNWKEITENCTTNETEFCSAYLKYIKHNASYDPANSCIEKIYKDSYKIDCLFGLVSVAILIQIIELFYKVPKVN